MTHNSAPVESGTKTMTYERPPWTDYFYEPSIEQLRGTFPTEVRLEFDASYEPVVLGHTMFIPSMVTDSVTAIETSTGAIRWRFFAGGPVRFAPVADANKVFFVMYP